MFAGVAATPLRGEAERSDPNCSHEGAIRMFSGKSGPNVLRKEQSGCFQEGAVPVFKKEAVSRISGWCRRSWLPVVDDSVQSCVRGRVDCVLGIWSGLRVHFWIDMRMIWHPRLILSFSIMVVGLSAPDPADGHARAWRRLSRGSSWGRWS